MRTRSIQLSDELIQALTVAATERDVSVNWLINKLCEEGLMRLVPEMKVTA